MNRPLLYANASLAVESLLRWAQSDMISQGAILQAILNTTTPVVSGLDVGPTSPASLSVLVAPGLITSYEPADASGYGLSSLALTDAVTKIGINTAPTTLSFTPPATVGQSANYLVEAKFDEEDTDLKVLSYKDPTTQQVVQGPSGSNVSQPTQRTATVSLRVKAGVAANTGSQASPAPDTGWSGLAVVTLAHGQTTISGGDITIYPGRPSLSALLARSSDLAAYLTIASAQATYVQESETSTAGTAGTVVRRDGSGAITAPVIHGKADSAIAADNATRAASAASADTTAHAAAADHATTAGDANTVQGFAPSNSASAASSLAVRDGLGNINCGILHGKADYAANADTLGTSNAAPDINATPSTVVVRDASGNINAAHINGEASSADFADLGERFQASEPLSIGDLVEFGGDKEIQLARGGEVFGVVSGAPAFRMNAGAGNDASWPYVCWAGRVPVKVQGSARKGDYLVLSALGGVAIPVPSRPSGATVIGRVLESVSGDGVNLVLAAVRAHI